MTSRQAAALTAAQIAGLTAAQVERMKEEFGIYAVSTGRICLAALNSKNIDYVAKAIAAVTK
jgi:aromatic-amino-acid transaminase